MLFVICMRGKWMGGRHTTSVKNFDDSIAENPNDPNQCTPFDYDEVDPADEPPSFEPDEVQKLGEILREVITWLVQGDQGSAGYGKTVMRKTIAMSWVLRPELFNGEPLSEIAKKEGINVYKQSLSKQAIRFSERFGVKGRGQRKRIRKAKNS
mgnify:CR=1 FL=1